MTPSDKTQIAQTVAAMLHGESAAIDRLPKELRAVAYQQFRDAVAAGKGVPGVHYGG